MLLNLPNSITAFRILLIPVFMTFLLGTLPGGDVLAVVTFTIAAATDSLDGYFARRRSQTTVLGTFLDPLADKLLISAAATMRRPDTADSLAIITIATHADTFPRSTKATSAAEIRSLSAKGSRNVPSTVVWLLRRAK